MWSMATFITILVILAIIANVGIGTIIFWIILGIAILSGFVGIIAKLTPTRYYTRNCPWGYHDYGCQPNCPMHEHCWGPNTMNNDHSNDNSAEHNHFGRGFLPDVPARPENEDGDWRTVYMDDTRYDDRERDEEFDNDRFDNGGW